MSYFIDVILPIPVENTFTYLVSEREYGFIALGMRVAVPFGKTKIYASIVKSKHTQVPTIYEAKEIFQILDDRPIVTPEQLKLWSWMASYYMCSEGEVMRAALPKAFMLESETVIKLHSDRIEPNELTLKDDEFLIYEALQHQSELKVHEVMDILDKKKVLPSIQRLIDKGVIEMQEEIYEKYAPKIVKFITLSPQFESESTLNELLNTLSSAPKQREMVLTFFSLKAKKNKPISSKDLQNESGATAAQLKALIKKGVFKTYEMRQDRIGFDGETSKTQVLNSYQKVSYASIEKHLDEKEVVLLHGVTASGKTEIYVQLIEKMLSSGNQILYLLPEIALTTQLITRLQTYFGEKVAVFHSKYSVNERVEVWNNVLQKLDKAQIVIGARSALLLPFRDLGFIVVDEEHESSFKQYDPAPRYHARDCAIVLASIFKAKVLLGSATPSLETMHNAQIGKYGYVSLKQRHGNILMPEINLVDIKEKSRKREMTGHFSDTLLKAIAGALDLGEQVILFQNRRGFSPILECTTCGHAPQCPNCDVSLTYHKYRSQLRCHYCGYNIALQQKCMACGGSELTTKGFGTEQIEAELKNLFPDKVISRMDSDTTRGKYGFEKLITAFEQEQIDILVGTQMLTKGLDFRNVSLVGIMNADSMLNFPDFRAHERSYQLIAQVAGRAGRTQKQGKVLVQTYNPYHQILQQVSLNKFDAMYEEQLEERRTFKYSPFYRLIRITLRHRDYEKIETSSVWLVSVLKQSLGEKSVLGPETPSIARIRNQYRRNILIKIPQGQNLVQTKKVIKRVESSFNAIPQYRSVRLVIDVDCY
ncbi:primosomal protein N' [Dokdonia sp. Hel_I_53]|uniref:replication restart helicase PriA n=1 Tax=Dokdonia sp. Hel_I_53 TaxID=1566287 RepID=UPI00119907E9|nr:primosomal protein N' [Dokdonia sp. Hel_I_53]TVZ51503.1 replication restart DNA helicase PriA [Dokdonia sp. Hel_I_53]